MLGDKNNNKNQYFCHIFLHFIRFYQIAASLKIFWKWRWFSFLCCMSTVGILGQLQLWACVFFILKYWLHSLCGLLANFGNFGFYSKRDRKILIFERRSDMNHCMFLKVHSAFCVVNVVSGRMVARLTVCIGENKVVRIRMVALVVGRNGGLALEILKAKLKDVLTDYMWGLRKKHSFKMIPQHLSVEQLKVWCYYGGRF